MPGMVNPESDRNGCIASYLAAAAARFLGDVEGWRPTGVMQGARPYARSIVDAVREGVARREPWRAKGFETTRGVAADEPESFYIGNTGIRCVVDPLLPPDRIEIRDPDTGEVRAYWGEHGIFEVLPPRWRR